MASVATCSPNIIKHYSASNGIQTPFTFREDGWFNMTRAAATFNKDLQSFIRMDETQAYIAALAEANSVPGTDYVEAVRGRHGGTWAHPKLAIRFAQWLDVKFSIWCDAMIEDILKGRAEVVITKPAESAVMALPKDYGSALRALAYRSLLRT
jgi:hypothetical protein